MRERGSYRLGEEDEEKDKVYRHFRGVVEKISVVVTIILLKSRT